MPVVIGKRKTRTMFAFAQNLNCRQERDRNVTALLVRSEMLPEAPCSRGCRSPAFRFNCERFAVPLRKNIYAALRRRS